MSRGESFKSRADDDFTSHFMGQSRPEGAPDGLVITEGPFAAPVSDPISFRRHQMSNEAPNTAGTYAKRARAPEAEAVVTPVGGPVRVSPAPEVKTAASDISPTMSNLDLPGRPVSRPEVSGRGVSSMSGSDVGHLPPPDTKPMALSTAPETGKRAPAVNAKQVTQTILKTLGRRGPVPAIAVPVQNAPGASGDLSDKQPANDGRDRMSMTHSGVNGSELHTGYSREKVGSVLRAVGAPSTLVTEDSILWLAACEKMAAVADAGDAGDYVTRDDTHPMALFNHLGTRYGTEWLDWDLEVIQQTLADDLGRDPATSTMNKIAALKMLTNKPERVYSDWHVFEKVAVAFDGASPRLTLIEDLSPEQMAFAASVMRMAAPDPRPVDGWQFSTDMNKYCAARLFDAGLVLAPPELGFCDSELANLASDQTELRKAAMSLYADALRGKEPKDIDQDQPPPDFVQAARLMRIHAYVLDKIDDLVRQAL